MPKDEIRTADEGREMILFRCQCSWSYIIGKKKVYGPIIENDASLARMRPREDWEAKYGDCAYKFELAQEIVESVNQK